MRRYNNHRGTGGGVGRCRGAVGGLGETVVLGEVGQGVLVVLENDGVGLTTVDFAETDNGGVFKGEQVSRRHRDKAKAASRYDVLVEQYIVGGRASPSSSRR